MIVFNRLNGKPVALNPDLIERVEATPDTVVTLTNGTKFLVSENLDQALHLITDFRAYVMARSRDLVVEDGPRPALHVVPNELAVAHGTDPIRADDLDEILSDDSIVDFPSAPNPLEDR